jgi:hypothetical protein
MQHGGSRSFRLSPLPAEPFERPKLRWTTTGAFTYSLGPVGTMSLNRDKAWSVRMGGLTIEFRSLDAARKVIERAARSEGYEIES